MADSDQSAKKIDRFSQLPRPLRFLRARIRLMASLAVGIAVLLLLPPDWRWSRRFLIAWDVTVALYLAAAAVTVWRTGTASIRRHAIEQDDGRFVILIGTAVAALASLAAILSEIGASDKTAPHLVLAVVTIVLSWLFVHTSFALHYAHDYYYKAKAEGLDFPGDDKPDYWDFIYFSFVIGMTFQVSDVQITSRSIRRTATAHGVVSFIFNTALVALMVNIAASAI
jgi:uncharacterized membrane protein